MNMDRPPISRKIGLFKADRRAALAIAILALVLAAWRFMAENPQHNPWAPLDLRDPVGWATASKLSSLRDDPALCRAVLTRSEIAFEALPPSGEGACARSDRTLLTAYPFAGRQPATTCAVGAGLDLWMERSVRPAAEEVLGSKIVSVQHYGAYSCRRLYGRDDGPWSEHATGNAIDISGFVLADGRQISLLADWEGDADRSAFLKRIRDEACDIFGTVLSPDYNEQHRDHFHLDQAARSWSTCR